MITKLVTIVRQRLDKKRRYNVILAEIAALNARDLQELRADPVEMRRVAYNSIYGAAR